MDLPRVRSDDSSSARGSAAELPCDFFRDLDLGAVQGESRRVLRNRSFSRRGRDVLASVVQAGEWLGSEEAAQEFRERTQQLPRAGDNVLGFRLVRELGRGAFARVFLAEQSTLASRRVAAKITRTARNEAQTLAQLQHTHIMPIYSAHADASSGLHMLVMPYFGGTTLDRLLAKARADRHATGHSLLAALDALSLRDDPSEHSAFGESLPASHAFSLQPSRSPNDTTAATVSPWLASRLFGRSFVGTWRNVELAQPVIGQPARGVLQRSSYVQAVTWIAARLAEGLAHAHERGILHRDIKPSNVLVAADGQPMLLDFNLARDLKSNDSGAVAYVGGTLPYMAPEHLDAFNVENSTPPTAVDARSDIYSLGVVLFEMLTGVRPFMSERPGQSLPRLLDMLAAERRRAAPSPRAANAAVPRSLDAIVRRCLEPDPARRYPDAAQLAEDLGRELESLPLRHTREPSYAERLKKWSRRHPRLSSGGSIALLSTVLVTGLTALVLVIGGRLAGYDVERRWGLFQQGLVRAQLLVHTGPEPGQNLDAGEHECESTLALFGVLDDDNWFHRSRAARLSSDQRAQLAEGTTELLILFARAKAERGRLATSPKEREALVGAAVQLLTRAARALGDSAPRSLYEDRGEYRRWLGDTDGADADWRRAERTPLRTARDHYLRATSLAAEKRYDQAIAELDAALRLDPKHFWSHFTLGICHDQLGRYAEAVRIYGTAIALWPDFPWGYLNRGLASSRLGNWPAAIEDYSTAIRLDAACADARVNRGVAYLKQHRYAEADVDLSVALDNGRRKAGVWAARGAARTGLGHFDAARRDYEQALTESPGDAAVLMSRGFAFAKHDPQRSLADFDRIIEREPNSAQAHYGRAVALSMTLEMAADAIAAAHRALELDPNHAEARATLAVLLARTRQFDEAIREAETVLGRNSAGHIIYSAACVYALATATDRNHADRAIALLKQALDSNYGLNQLDNDHDFDPLRNDVKFQRLSAEYFGRK